MNDDFSQDPNAYFRNLQQLATEQDRAKLTTLALEFGGVLQRLPRMKAEMDAFLAPQQALDYTGLVARLEPQLEQVAAFLDELDFLPAELRKNDAVREFSQLACGSLTFRTVGNIHQRLQMALEEAQKKPPEPPPVVKPASAWAGQTGQDQYGRYGDLLLCGVKQRFRWVQPGSFLMGSPESEAERSSDETQHRVTLTQGFWLADTACTQDLWVAVMGNNPARFSGDLENPVEQVSWDDVQLFLQRANDFVPDGVLRLPTEAEWEYACRAGTTSPFSFGMNITPNQVNYDGNYPYNGGSRGVYREATAPVKALPTNPWGLYQMHGNVWEWCQDWYGDYPTAAVTDPTGVSAGTYRVLRGGSWSSDAQYVRSAFRHNYAPDFRSSNFGFRFALGQAS